jgi:uncharacterized membrane protein
MAGFHILAGADSGSTPEIKTVTFADIAAALREGFEDFWAMPTHLVFLGVIYPVCGGVLAYFASRGDLLQLVFPLASGLALIGPIAAVGLYELSRRRERGLEFSWPHTFDVLRSPSLPALAVLSLFLAALFALWIIAAQEIYVALYGSDTPATLAALLTGAVSSGRGQLLFLIGGVVGFGFAALTFAVSVLSFPLLLDRDVGLVLAVRTSLAAVRANPIPMAGWALTIAVALVLGSLPLFVGLAIVMPVLGHASWRFYRRVVVREPQHENPSELPLWEPRRPPSYAARPHAVLFPWPDDNK